MNERTVLLAEALGHWVLAWTLVVLAVAMWIRVQRPRQAAIRYGGWLLATFAGAGLLPVVVAVGPLVLNTSVIYSHPGENLKKDSKAPAVSGIIEVTTHPHSSKTRRLSSECYYPKKTREARKNETSSRTSAARFRNEPTRHGERDRFP